MQDTAYEEAWDEGEDVPLVDAVRKAGVEAAAEIEDEYLRAHRELEAEEAEGADRAKADKDQPKGDDEANDKDGSA